MSHQSSPFLDRVSRGPILADGGMGTMLYNRGISFDHCFDALNLSLREVVLGIHQDYIRAGAQLIETNTFGATCHKLNEYGLTPSLREIRWTAPYMHDGSKPTLEAVLDHYAGGFTPRAGLSTNMVRGLTLSAGERAALRAFLATLSSPTMPKPAPPVPEPGPPR